MPTSLVHGLHQYRDWRAADADVIVPLVQAEIEAWRDTLSWDVSESWRVIEPARQAGQLPGLVVSDAGGRPVGWTAFLPHQGYLQVLAFVADDIAATEILLDGLLTSPEARACASTILCVRGGGPALRTALARRGFTCDDYRYQVVALDDRAMPGPVFDRWSDHETAMATLCAEAYRDSPGVRAFAPGGTWPEWQHYIGTLVHGTGCGWFMPELSAVVAAETSEESRDERATLAAALMLSDLGTGTAHVAQLAVAPTARGRGLGRQLVQTTLAASSRFYEQVSLLVSASNVPAVRLYESMGFRDRARFIVASHATSPR